MESFHIKIPCFLINNMDKLGNHTHQLLTDKVLKSLLQNRISTLLEFLGEDVHKLSTLTKLTLPQVILVRCELLTQFSAQSRKGNYIDTERKTRQNVLFTGINRLDGIIGGGVPVGCITEICGLAGSGKTQLCFAIAIHVALSSDDVVLYVDTKGDFSAVTIQKYLEKKGCSHEEMAKTMERIQVVRVWTMIDLIELLNQIKIGRYKYSNLRLIVVDSLPCLMLQFLGDETKIGLTLLNKFVNVARYLSKEMRLSMLCVNILTRWVEQASQDIEEQDSTLQNLAAKGAWVEKKQRCLGRYWQHIPALVLQLEMGSKDSKEHAYIVGVTVTKFVAGLCDLTCNLYLGGDGIT